MKQQKAGVLITSLTFALLTLPIGTKVEIAEKSKSEKQ